MDRAGPIKRSVNSAGDFAALKGDVHCAQGRGMSNLAFFGFAEHKNAFFIDCPFLYFFAVRDRHGGLAPIVLDKIICTDVDRAPYEFINS